MAEAGDRVSVVTTDVVDRVDGALQELKPRLRGWLHAASLPLMVAAGIVLIVLSPDATIRWASAVYTTSAVLLFGVSALYHTGSWSPSARERLRRVDHANIFLLIAGSYTPFSLLLLERSDAVVLLRLVWGGAVAGVTFRMFWLQAPRWVHTPIYVALGWAALLWLPQFAASASTAVFVLMITGGGLYSLGGLVYGVRWPDPFPSWFGFHEVFHVLTIAAFVVHYVGISIAAYTR